MKNKRQYNYINYLCNYSQKQLINAKAKSFIIGLSGGIDSALVLAILKQNPYAKIYGVFIDIGSSKLDKECVLKLVQKFKCNFIEINLDKEYNSFVKNLKLKNKLSLANLKSRMRMNALYSFASEHNGLVVGTSNANERLVGYFTKFGDGANDFQLISELTKNDVYIFSKLLSVPKKIIDRKPTGGLFENQYDEDEIGIKYNVMDNFLNKKKVDGVDKVKIKSLYLKNKHKLKLPPRPKKYNSLRKVW